MQCKRCGTTMIMMKSSKTGKLFPGCPNYKRCKDFANQYEAPTKLELASVADEEKPKRVIIPSAANKRILAAYSQTNSAICIEAGAGCGKSTQLWLLATQNPKNTFTYLVFSKKMEIDALKTFAGVTNTLVSTFHSFGRKALVKTYPKAQMNADKNEMIIRRYYPPAHDLPSDRSVRYAVRRAAVKLLAKTKQFADKPNYDDLLVRFDLDIPLDIRNEVYALVDLAYVDSMQFSVEFDFDDMIWALAKDPIVLSNLAIPQNTLLDESQDFNAVQQYVVAHLARQGSRIIYVGDERQAIFAFRGADSDSMNRLRGIVSELGSLTVLPLMETRRCGKNIVKEAQRVVGPGFTAHESNPDGVVEQITDDTFMKMLKAYDFVLCRNNAPLVKLAFALIRKHANTDTRVIFTGRELGDELRTLIQRVCKGVTPTLAQFIELLEAYRDEQGAILKEKGVKGLQALAVLADKIETIGVFIESDNVQTVVDLELAINRMFNKEHNNDTRNAIVLSTIHSAKGLEADRVFLIETDLLPHPKARGEALQQEFNLLYVAITRAKLELYYVGGQPTFPQDVYQEQEEEEQEL